MFAPLSPFAPFTRRLPFRSSTIHLWAFVHTTQPVSSLLEPVHTVSLSSVTLRFLDNAIASSLFHLYVPRETTKQAGQCRRRRRRRHHRRRRRWSLPPSLHLQLPQGPPFYTIPSTMHPRVFSNSYDSSTSNHDIAHQGEIDSFC